jgi:hypothetical protein
MTELISKDIVDLLDIEKVQFLQTLKSDPAQYNAYVTTKANRILDEVIDTKRASFVKVSSDMARMFDMDHNSIAALDRTKDLVSAQGHILTQQTAEESAVKDTLQLTRRQVEINNWYYENKRETLFILQVLLLVMLVVVMSLGAAAQGWISTAAGNYAMSLAVLVGAGTWLYRWYYTAYVRDPRYWSRRNFKEDSLSLPTGELCIGEGGSKTAAK